ncbi:MAG: SCO family protein [Arenicella sp.]|nr:SCO family protein [Arenicella sp.]
MSSENDMDQQPEKNSKTAEQSTDRSRRQLLTGVTIGAGGLLAAGLSSRAQANQVLGGNGSGDVSGQECLDDSAGKEASRFPQHAIVYDHHGRKRRFYNDLIKNKIVMLQFMSTELEGDYQTAKNLSLMQDILGSRFGRDVFLISATVDPERDTVEVLSNYAKQHNVSQGWSFITGTVDTMQSIKDALFFRPGGHSGHEGHDQQDCSMGLIRYGNDATGLWGSVPTRTNPHWLAERLNWITPKASDVASIVKRGGPPARES